MTELKKEVKEEIPPVMLEGTILVARNYAHILFDYGFMHSFLTPLYVVRLGLKPQLVGNLLFFRYKVLEL